MRTIEQYFDVKVEELYTRVEDDAYEIKSRVNDICERISNIIY